MNTYTVEEVANKLQLSKATLNRWRGTGEGPKFLKLGGAIRYRQEDVQDWMSRQLVNSTSELLN